MGNLLLNRPSLRECPSTNLAKPYQMVQNRVAASAPPIISPSEGRRFSQGSFHLATAMKMETGISNDFIILISNDQASQEGNLPSRESHPDVPRLMGWSVIRNRIKKFSERSRNWDSYDAHPLSIACKLIAEELVDALEREGVTPFRVGMTSDSDLLISCQIQSCKAEWQIDSDGDIAAMFHCGETEPSFHDIPYPDVEFYLTKLRDGAI